MKDSASKFLMVSNITAVAFNVFGVLAFVTMVHTLHSKFEKTLAEMQAPVHGMTRFFQAMPHSALYIPIVVVLLIGIFAKEKVIESLLSRFIINKVIFIVIVLLFIAYIVGMLMPLYSVQTITP